jgi:hypothetical protein
MGNMPEWFAKTPEMCASDLYFSEADAGNKLALGDRYVQALQALVSAPRGFFMGSKALDAAVVRGGPLDQAKVDHALNVHFHRDWINQHYNPADPATFNLGGRYWPTIPSETVLNVLQLGTFMAILKALGETNVQNMGVDPDTIHELFEPEHEAGVDTNGIRALATSWNCVAPPGSNFFEAAALRGPNVVELAIATPRPVALTRFAITIDRIGRDELSLAVPNPDITLQE